MKYKIKTFQVQLELHEKGEKITDAPEAVKIARSIFDTLDADREHFVALFLNRANKVEGYKVLFSGSPNQTPVFIQTLFRYALLANASAIIVCHNHPAGSLKPSPEDIQITEKIREAGELLGVPLLDHIILTDDDYLSMQAEGWE